MIKRDENGFAWYDEHGNLIRWVFNYHMHERTPMPYGNVQCPQMPAQRFQFQFPDEEWFDKVRRELNSRGPTTGAKMKRVNRERRRAVYVLAQVLPADVCGVVWSFLKRLN